MTEQAQFGSTWSPSWRAAQLAQLKTAEQVWDLVIVGGGITGAGIYREAAFRGLKVLLVEQQDFAWGTSSRSSKMVHGGLRYLGSGQFGLANDSVKERQKLLEQLPGLVDPLPFLMAHYKGGFPGPWIFDKLLAIYDWMAGKRYRHFVQQGVTDYLAPGLAQANLKGATCFADAVTDDARLVMRVLHDGNSQGGVALNYLRAVNTLKSESQQVTGLTLEDQVSGERFDICASVVVNASGAWTDELRASLGKHKVIRPLRGSHLVVPHWRLPLAYSVVFSHPEDKRSVFVFPWEGTTAIGTTDLDHREDMQHEAGITQEEVDYLLAAANAQFTQANLSADDVLSTWSGVRPVVSNNQDKEVDLSKAMKPSDEKREHAIWNDQGMISVAGGKLTTYRLIALEVLREAAELLSGKLALTSLSEPVPFGTQGPESGSISNSVSSAISSAAPSVRQLRLAGRYGEFVGQVQALTLAADLPEAQARILDSDTLWAELLWACQRECVVNLDDLLLRRTRLGLLLGSKLERFEAEIAAICQQALGWDDGQWQQQWQRYLDICQKYYRLPSTNSLNK